MNTMSTSRVEILIVDDRPENLLALEAVFSSTDYRLIRAYSGRDAFEACEVSEFAAIILDIQMPGMDGFEAAQKIRRSGRNKKTPILFLTANDRDDFVEKAYRVGAVDYLTKPLNELALKTKIAFFAELFQHRGEESRRQSERLFEKMADSAPVLVWMTGIDKGCSWFNKGWVEWTGRRLEQELGDGWAQGVHPDDRERCLKTFNENFDRRREFYMEYRLRHRSGEYRWVSDRGVPSYSAEGEFEGYIGGCMDIHEQQAAQEQLARNEAKYRSLFENMAEEVHFWHLVRDEHGNVQTWRLLDANSPALKTWNQSLDQVVGRTTDEIFGAGSTAHYMPIVKRILQTGEPHVYEDYFPKLDRYFRFTSIPVGECFFTTGADITEIKKAEMQLRESEARFRQLADSIPQLAWTANAEGVTEYVNAQWINFTGTTADQVVDAFTKDLVHPDDRESLGVSWLSAMKSSVEFSVEFRLRNAKSGQYEWFLTRGIPLKDADGQVVKWFGTNTNIQEHRKVLDELERSKDRLTIATTAAEIGIWDWDVVSGLVANSSIQRRIFDYEPSSEHVPYQTVVDRILPEDRPMVERKLRDAIERGVDYIAEFRILRRDKSIAWLYGRGRAGYDETGRPVRVYGVNVDITERKVIQEKLEEAKLAAERASHAKTAFLTNMSHEIRTPLGAIIGFSELLSSALPVDEKAQGYIERISRNSAQLSRLIDELLDLSKIEANRLEIERVPVDLTAAIEDAFAAIAHRAAEKGLEFEDRRLSNLPRFVRTDPTRVRQILINLVGNAVKFTEKGKITIETRVVHRASGREGAQSGGQVDLQFLEMRVTDTGIGLDEIQQRQLFNPFTQADASITRKYGGTGLGLSLSRQLARLLGGDIVLEKSALGKGTTFKFTLSLAPMEEHARHQEVAAGGASEKSGRAVLNGNLILIVDDSTDNQVLVSRFLDRAEASYDVANNGEEAVAMAKKRNYDLILMDLQMPKMDGYSAHAAIRAQGFRNPIVALTAHALKSERDRCYNEGFTSYITKPINPKILVQTIAELTHQNQTERRAEVHTPDAVS